MHGLVLLDAGGKVLRPSILWNDQRTQQQCDEITEKIGFTRLIELTGNRALTGFTAPKILWVRENEPEIYAKGAHVLLPKDYIRFMLTGDYVMDVSDASGTVLLDVANRRWSSEVLDALDIPAIVAAAPRRRTGGHGRGQRSSRRTDRTESRHAGGRRRRRSGGGRGRRRRGRAGDRLAGGRHVGRGLRAAGELRLRAGRSAARLLPCRAGRCGTSWA